MLHFSTSDQKKKKKQKKPNDKKLKSSIKPYRKNSKENRIDLNPLQWFISGKIFLTFDLPYWEEQGQFIFSVSKYLWSAYHIYDIREPKNTSSTSTPTLVNFCSTFRIQQMSFHLLKFKTSPGHPGMCPHGTESLSIFCISWNDSYTFAVVVITCLRPVHSVIWIRMETLFLLKSVSLVLSMVPAV